MQEHQKILSHLLLVGQREAVVRITPGITAQLNPLRVQMVEATAKRGPVSEKITKETEHIKAITKLIYFALAIVTLAIGGLTANAK